MGLPVTDVQHFVQLMLDGVAQSQITRQPLEVSLALQFVGIITK